MFQDRVLYQRVNFKKYISPLFYSLVSHIFHIKRHLHTGMWIPKFPLVKNIQAEEYRCKPPDYNFLFQINQTNKHRYEKTSRQTSSKHNPSNHSCLCHHSQLKLHCSDKVHLPGHLGTSFRWEVFQIVRSLSQLLLVFQRPKELPSPALSLIAKHP